MYVGVWVEGPVIAWPSITRLATHVSGDDIPKTTGLGALGLAPISRMRVQGLVVVSPGIGVLDLVLTSPSTGVLGLVAVPGSPI